MPLLSVSTIGWGPCRIFGMYPFPIQAECLVKILVLVSTRHSPRLVNQTEDLDRYQS